MTGGGLLNLTVDDLYKLHVEKVGHQEIILEALELLKNLVSAEFSLQQESVENSQVNDKKIESVPEKMHS